MPVAGPHASMHAVAKIAPLAGAIELVERTPRDPGPSEVLLEIGRAGICGTDLAIRAWPEWVVPVCRPPVTLGHEGAGTVIARGSEVATVDSGDVVAVESHLYCGSCARCRSGDAHVCEQLGYVGLTSDGLFARYATVDARQVVPLPSELDADLGALLEPFGLAVRNASTGSGAQGQSMLVTGGGPIGLMTALVAKRLGAARVLVSEVNPYRLEHARRVADDFGVDDVLDPSTSDVVSVARASTGGAGVDVWIDVAGAPSVFAQAVAALRIRGEARLFAPGMVPMLNLADVVIPEITLRGVHGRLLFDTWDHALSLVPSMRSQLRSLVTHELGLEDFETAFAILEEGRAMKILLDTTS